MKAFQAVSLFFVSVLFNQILVAQTKASKYEVGIAMGGFVYQGDLAPGRFGSLKTIRPGLVLQGTRKLTNTTALRLNLSFASLRGDDAKYTTPAYRQFRNFNFRSPLYEISPQLMWSPGGWNEVGARLTPYAFAGISLAYMRVQRDYSNFNASHFGLEEDLPARIALDMQRRTPTLLPAIPLGAGIRYAISPSFVFTGELNYRYTFSDYIDGFSRAANSRQRDHYYGITIGIVYRFGKKNSWNCPPVKQ